MRTRRSFIGLVAKAGAVAAVAPQIPLPQQVIEFRPLSPSEFLPFQDQIGNILRQYMLTVKKNLVNLELNEA